MVREEVYEFDGSEQPQVKKSAVAGFCEFIWNSNTKEFCGRDGASWSKLGFFYCLFYIGLGSFFIAMLAVFVQTMPKDRPTYYAETSTMAVRGVNPGLGFRPQVDVEDSLIMYNPKVNEHPTLGYKKYVDNLEIFLGHKYKDLDESEKENTIKCNSNSSYADDLKKGKSCEFNYKKIFESTDCTLEKKFGFDTSSPCILLKLNKIVSWIPDAPEGFIGIRCEGETSVDRDNIQGVTYYSEDDTSDVKGKLDNKYYPFFVQKSYRAPLVFAKFQVSLNTLVNIECKGIANNIDYGERIDRRGLTKFSLFVVADSKKN